MCEITLTSELVLQKIMYVVHYLLGANFPSWLSNEINPTLSKINQINIISYYPEECENQSNNKTQLCCR